MTNIVEKKNYYCVCDGQHISLTYKSIEYLSKIVKDFDTIIEIGTYKGGLTYWFNLNKKEGAKVISYDIKDYKNFKENDITFIIRDVFDEVSVSEIKNFIQNGGKTLLFCDGGFKNQEFNIFSKFLKNEDHIMLHDFLDDTQPEPYASFEDSAGWCHRNESNYLAINNSVNENGLVKFMYEDFRRNIIGSFKKN
jgi:hypothetical protein